MRNRVNRVKYYETEGGSIFQSRNKTVYNVHEK